LIHTCFTYKIVDAGIAFLGGYRDRMVVGFTTTHAISIYHH